MTKTITKITRKNGSIHATNIKIISTVISTTIIIIMTRI